MMNVGFAPVLEYTDYHWEIFLWGDPPIKPTSGKHKFVFIYVFIK